MTGQPLLAFLAAGPATPTPTQAGGGSVTLAASLTGLGAALVTLLIWYLRDRRKSKAEASVAEATVQADIEKHNLDADDARLVYVLKQVDAERAFHAQQVMDRDAEIARQRAELSRRDELVAHLRAQIEHLEAQLGEVTRQMTEVRTQLNELASDSGDN